MLRTKFSPLKILQVQVEEDEGNYALKMSTFYQFLKDEFLTDCTFMVGPSGQVEVYKVKEDVFVLL